MSLYDYRASQELERKDVPFDALIMAAMRKADTFNAWKLQAAFPELWTELSQRYHAPGGVLPGEAVPPLGSVGACCEPIPVPGEEPLPCHRPVGHDGDHQGGSLLLSYTCPRCGRVSFNPNDFKHRYCGACHKFEDQP